MRRVKITREPDLYVAAGDQQLAGSFGRKWGIAGTTAYSRHRPEAIITIIVNEAPTVEQANVRTSAYSMACLHEYGHVDILDDLFDQVETWDDAAKLMRGYDVYQAEIEAWLRGLAIQRARLDYTDYMFVLDALNTYRRGYNVSDKDWADGRNLLLQCVIPNMRDRAKDYVPLEPDPGSDPTRSCMRPLDEHDEVEDDDESDGGASETDETRPEGYSMRQRWAQLPHKVAQDVISGRMTLAQVAQELDLDLRAAPDFLIVADEVNSRNRKKGDK